MSLLTGEDRTFFKANGYLVLRDAVPKRNCDAVIEDIFRFLEMDPNDHDGWYRRPLEPGRCVELYHTQSMWNNRQHPRIHEAFAQLWGNAHLWCSIDRVSFKPPAHPAHPDWDVEGFLHWDLGDMAHLPIQFGLQGVLCLTDTAADQGGFHCVPGGHKDLTREPRPADVLTAPDLDKLTPVPVPAHGGDLIIWHRALPHGNGRNRSSNPRLAQYITMGPAPVNHDGAGHDARRLRIATWKQKCTKQIADPSLADTLPEPADIHLTPLGRKLLGVDPW